MALLPSASTVLCLVVETLTRTEKALEGQIVNRYTVKGMLVILPMMVAAQKAVEDMTVMLETVVVAGMVRTAENLLRQLMMPLAAMHMEMFDCIRLTLVRAVVQVGT